MPLPRHITDDLAAKRLAESREAARDERRAMARTAFICLGWCALGLCLMAWSFHTDDEVLGRAAFWGSLGVGNGGIIFTLLGAYRRGEERGDW